MIGVALPLTAVLVGAFDSAVGDVVGGLLMVLFVSALGAAVQFRGTARLRGLDQAKLREREQLARERTTPSPTTCRPSPSRPRPAAPSPSLVPRRSSTPSSSSRRRRRALTEMRTIVGALRRGEQSDLTPQPGVADIERLARSNGNRRRSTSR